MDCCSNDADFLFRQAFNVKQLKRLSQLTDGSIKQCNDERVACEQERSASVKLIGNMLHDTVPVSNDEVCSHSCRGYTVHLSHRCTATAVIFFHLFISS